MHPAATAQLASRAEAAREARTAWFSTQSSCTRVLNPHGVLNPSCATLCNVRMHARTVDRACLGQGIEEAEVHGALRLRASLSLNQS